MTRSGDVLFENANAGFKAYEEKMLCMSKKQIFDKAYEINAKNEIHGYLCDCAIQELDEDDIEVLVSKGENVIEELYAYYISIDNASVMYYSDITEWITDFCREALK